MSGLYRYCPHNRVSEAIRMGWTNLGPLPGNHGFYQVLVFWEHEGDVAPWFDGEGGQ
jgi:hypothetical protein